jgi:hypothetical protein
MQRITLKRGKFPEYMDFIDRFDFYLQGEASFEATDEKLIEELKAIKLPSKFKWTIPIDFYTDLVVMYSSGEERCISLVEKIFSTMGVYWQ